MSRPRSPNRDMAFKLYKESNGRITSVEIAKQLNEKVGNINNWRVQDKWKDKVGKKGAPFGNKNAVGNRGGGAPEANQNHYIRGFYSKYFPKKVVSILELTEGMDPLDILWVNIQTKFATIINSQKIMYVKDHNDMTKEIKKTMEGKEIDSVEYEIQFAWDKQATFLKAQSTAMAQLTNMIKRYDEMLHANWDTVTEEQRLRAEKLKLNVNNTEAEIKSRRKIAEDKLQLSKDRFEHQKEIDGKKYW